MTHSEIRTILGTGDFSRRTNLQDSEEIANAFYKFQKNVPAVEYDTALLYVGGKSEKTIGQMDLRIKSNVQIATKANTMNNKLFDAAGLRKQLETSLSNLKLSCVQIFYLHAPDHKTPIIETLKEVNILYQEKKFKEFGLSNYAAWQVAEICTICKNQGWVLPTVYQGMYSCLTRQVEKELFPCLRYFNLRFYAYSPLCAGILTGKHKYEDATKSGLGRFFDEGWLREVIRKRYWRKEIFSAVDQMKHELNEVYGDEVTLAEAALRWCYHHSKLDGFCGDGVILGASNIAYLTKNLNATVQGPLEDRVVKVFDECWNACCFNSPCYFR